MAVEVFQDDDAGYEAWLAAHPHGFVVNALRAPTSSYIKAHTARCLHITELHTGYTTWTYGSYIKVCGTSVDELDAWALNTVGVRTSRKCYCWG